MLRKHYFGVVRQGKFVLSGSVRVCLSHWFLVFTLLQWLLQVEDWNASGDLAFIASFLFHRRGGVEWILAQTILFHFFLNWLVGRRDYDALWFWVEHLSSKCESPWTWEHFVSFPWLGCIHSQIYLKINNLNYIEFALWKTKKMPPKKETKKSAP